MKKSEVTATGRRKRSVAQVKLVTGKGKITVNGRDVRDFFPYETNVMDLKQPLVATGTEESLHLSGLFSKFSPQHLRDFSIW